MGTMIIPCMGRSERFARDGHVGPKALLHVRREGQTWTLSERMIGWIVGSLPPDWRAVLVTPRKHATEFLAATRRVREDTVVLTMDESSRGQSHSVHHALRQVDQSSPVAVQNCDLLFSQAWLAAALATDDDVVAVHRDDGPQDESRYSYARPVEEGRRCVDFAEKRRISEWAMTGLWRITRASALRHAIERQMELSIAADNGELYLSGALGLSPLSGLTPMPCSDWADWGTPDAVRRSGWILG